MIIRLNEPDGTVTEYTVKTLDTVTVDEWLTMAIPDAIEKEDPMAVVSAWTGIPIDKLHRMPVGSVDQIADLVGKALVEAAAAKEDEWKPEPTVEVLGQRFKVPQNIEADTIYAQWVDINARVENATNERDIIPTILAILLVEEGTDYDGGKIAERMAFFNGAPAVFGLRMTAFFFANGKRLRDVMSRYTSKRLYSVQQSLQQAATALNNGTDGSAASSALLN